MRERAKVLSALSSVFRAFLGVEFVEGSSEKDALLVGRVKVGIELKVRTVREVSVGEGAEMSVRVIAGRGPPQEHGCCGSCGRRSARNRG